MRREELYLADIVEAADSIEHFLEGAEKQVFLADDLMRSAVLQKLTIIGEAAARLPVEFRKHHSQIEWADIIGFRNFAIHSYFSIDWNIVWTTAQLDVQELRTRVVEILDSNYPTDSSSGR